MRDGPVITVDGFYVRALQYITQHAPEIPNMIQNGLNYLSEKFINVRNRLHSAPDPTKRLQENTESSPLNNKDFHEDYIHESFHPRRRLSPDFSKHELKEEYN